MKSYNREELMARFEKTIDFVESCHEHRKPLHEIEKGIFDHLLGLGRLLLGLLFTLYGDGDQGERHKLDDGRELQRLKTLHKREYFSIFGVFELFRAVYGTREKQKIEWVLLDAQLSLPESKFSYLLQDWDQEFPRSQVSPGNETDNQRHVGAGHARENPPEVGWAKALTLRCRSRNDLAAPCPSPASMMSRQAFPILRLGVIFGK